MASGRVPNTSIIFFICGMLLVFVARVRCFPLTKMLKCVQIYKTYLYLQKKLVLALWSVATEDVAGIDFVFDIVQGGIVAVGYNGL